MLTVTRIYEFEAAHRLPNHDGKCRNLHGHSYKLEVSVVADPNSDGYHAMHGQKGLVDAGPKEGMLIDFSDLDFILQPLIKALDHHDLNEVSEALNPPTAENLVFFIVEGVKELLKEAGAAVRVKRVRLYETARAYVEYTD